MKLNKAQQEASEYMNGPMLILAGAGSGKTLTLVSRVAHLIEQGIKPEKILLLTFTNKAAQEMVDRARRMLDERAEKITACTFHSFCNKELRNYAKYIGYRNNFTILSQGEVYDAIGLIRSENTERYKRKGFPSNKALAGIFSMYINTGRSIEDIIQGTDFEPYIQEITEIMSKYQKYKKKQNLMDYDDLLVNFLTLLTQRGDIRKELGRQYEHILVDEYQDTNKLQESILFKLNTSNLTVVGDDYQSLYGFRGADINNILDFPKKFSDCKIVTLDENYRSSQEILDLANVVMSNKANFGFKKNMKGQFSSNVLPDVIEAGSPEEESKNVFVKIKEYLDSGVNPKYIAVLARTSRQLYFLETLLTEHNIEYDKYGGPKFLESEPVMDILAYIRTMINPVDQLAWFRVLKLYPGIGEKYSRDISFLCESTREFLVENKYKNNKFYKELVDLKAMLEREEKLPYDEMLGDIIAEYIMLRSRVIEDGRFQSEDARIEAEITLFMDKSILQELYNIATKYVSPTEFLDAITLDQNKEDEDVDKLVLSTIHSIKGLEYDTVFIMECSDRLFPSTPVWEEGSDEDMEELRCFYVAVTRAKNNLHIYWPSGAMVRNKWINLSRTHFLTGSEMAFTEVNEKITM